MSKITERWFTRSYQSGTHIVANDQARESPHFYIHAGYGDNDSYRGDVSGDLAAWLNGGRVPVWAGTLKRTGTTCCDGIGRIHIVATGPMRLPPNDNGRLAWTEFPEDEPKRIALMDRIAP